MVDESGGVSQSRSRKVVADRPLLTSVWLLQQRLWAHLSSAWALLKQGLVTLLLFAIGLSSLAVLVGMMVTRNWLMCAGSKAAFSSTGLLACAVTLVGAIPLAMPVLIALMSDSALVARKEFTIARAPSNGDSVPPRNPMQVELHSVAVRHWHYHEEQARTVKDRRFRHALCYATLATFWFSLLAAVLFYELVERPSSRPTPLMLAALTLFTGVVARFLLDVGQMLVRSARRDSTSRMFAQGSYHLTVTLLAAGVARLMISSSDQTTIKHPVALSVLAGICAAALGQRVLDVLLERVGKLFGVEPPQRTNGLPLTFLDGLDTAQEARFEEEGIDSIHALALASVPKLFFRTPFGLGQLCDWQDQAILVTHLGDELATQFRRQFGLRKATEVQQIAFAYQGAVHAQERDALLASVNLGGLPAARAVLDRFAADRSITLLSLYQLAAPRHAESSRADSGPDSPDFALSTSAAQ